MDYNNIKKSKQIQYFDRGLSALEFIIKNERCNMEDSILIPSFICKEVVDLLEKMHLKIFFYDINKTFNKIVKIPKVEKLRFFLFVNYFGFKFELSKENINYLENSIIIEDNSHNLFNFLQTKPTFDYSFYSPYKFINIPNGGFLFSNKIDHLKKINNYTNHGEGLFKIKRIIRKFRDTLPFYITIIIFFIVNKLFLFKSIYSKNDTHRNKKINFNSIKIIENFDYSKETIKRKNLYYFFLEFLKKYDVKIINLNLEKNIVPYGIPFYCKDENILKKIVKYVSNRGYTAVKWPEFNNKSISKLDDYFMNIWFINFL